MPGLHRYELWKGDPIVYFQENDDGLVRWALDRSSDGYVMYRPERESAYWISDEDIRSSLWDFVGGAMVSPRQPENILTLIPVTMIVSYYRLDIHSPERRTEMLRSTIRDVKQLDANVLTAEELAFARANLAALMAGYEVIGAEVPEWLEEADRELAVVYGVRERAEKLRELKNLKSRREALKTPDEKRKEVDADIVALEKELGIE